MKRPRRVPLWRCVVHLKSGNYIALVAEKFSVERDGAAFGRVEWEGLCGRVQPLGFDLREVEAVTAQRWGGRWVLR